MDNDSFYYLLSDDNRFCILYISKDAVNLSFDNIPNTEHWEECSIIQEELEKYCMNNLDLDSKMILINGYSN